jgi:hypothetical protein
MSYDSKCADLASGFLSDEGIDTPEARKELAQRIQDVIEDFLNYECPNRQPATSERTVTVCDQCLRACCWQGIFYCDDYRNAGTVEKTLAELAALNLEHPHYWRDVSSPTYQATGT